MKFIEYIKNLAHVSVCLQITDFKNVQTLQTSKQFIIKNPQHHPTICYVNKEDSGFSLNYCLEKKFKVK